MLVVFHAFHWYARWHSSEVGRKAILTSLVSGAREESCLVSGGGCHIWYQVDNNQGESLHRSDLESVE